jgi:hypothetical protein
MTRYSLLDLVPVVEGGTVAQALANAADLAAHAEAVGFHRYWTAEHHGMAGIASAATAVVLGHVAQARAAPDARQRSQRLPARRDGAAKLFRR